VIGSDRAALVYLTNLGCVSHHPWSCTVDALVRSGAVRRVVHHAHGADPGAGALYIRYASGPPPGEDPDRCPPQPSRLDASARTRERLSQKGDLLGEFFNHPQSLAPVLDAMRSRRARPMA
jgi:hypothetical protein